MAYSELAKLNLRQLHRLAAFIGAPCSGTKPSRIQGIQTAVQHALHLEMFQTRSKPQRNALSIVSIDMGIRNLAYCHLRTSISRGDLMSVPVCIGAWNRLSIEDPSPSATEEIQQLAEGKLRTTATRSKAAKEPYNPAIYAMRAHSFVKQIIDSHQPTHVVIERQRFRSGGSAAVQEWSIRVGVFEAMLYAAFHTLKAEKHYDCQVIPILPKRVNRYWLESDWEKASKQPSSRKTSSAVKLEKIECVQRILADAAMTNLDFARDAEQTRSAFVSRNGKQKPPGSVTKLKLDDLSDSFLQGLGWIHWQKNALRVEALGSGSSTWAIELLFYLLSIMGQRRVRNGTLVRTSYLAGSRN